MKQVEISYTRLHEVSHNLAVATFDSIYSHFEPDKYKLKQNGNIDAVEPRLEREKLIEYFVKCTLTAWSKDFEIKRD